MISIKWGCSDIGWIGFMLNWISHWSLTPWRTFCSEHVMFSELKALPDLFRTLARAEWVAVKAAVSGSSWLWELCYWYCIIDWIGAVITLDCVSQEICFQQSSRRRIKHFLDGVLFCFPITFQDFWKSGWGVCWCICPISNATGISSSLSMEKYQPKRVLVPLVEKSICY